MRYNFAFWSRSWRRLHETLKPKSWRRQMGVSCVRILVPSTILVKHANNYHFIVTTSQWDFMHVKVHARTKTASQLSLCSAEAATFLLLLCCGHNAVAGRVYKLAGKLNRMKRWSRYGDENAARTNLSVLCLFESLWIIDIAWFSDCIRFVKWNILRNSIHTDGRKLGRS